jgi:uncharacterized protein
MSLPKVVRDAWGKMSGPAVLTTVDSNGMPNTVYVSNITLFEDGTIGIADGAFNKTRANILAGSPGNFLFLTENAAYQLKGTFTYHSDKGSLERAKSWANLTFPIQAIVHFQTEIAYHGAEVIKPD